MPPGLNICRKGGRQVIVKLVQSLPIVWLSALTLIAIGILFLVARRAKTILNELLKLLNDEGPVKFGIVVLIGFGLFVTLLTFAIVALVELVSKIL